VLNPSLTSGVLTIRSALIKVQLFKKYLFFLLLGELFITLDCFYCQLSGFGDIGGCVPSDRFIIRSALAVNIAAFVYDLCRPIVSTIRSNKLFFIVNFTQC